LYIIFIFELDIFFKNGNNVPPDINVT